MYKTNLIKLKCNKCNDILTDGELTNYYNFREAKHLLPICYQCNIKECQERQKKWNVSNL